MKHIAQNTLVLLGVNLSSALFGLIISVAIGRTFGSEGLGRYSLVMAWTFALGIFAEFGLNTLITRDVARHREWADQYLLASSISKIAFSLVLMSALITFAPLLTHDNEAIVALQLGSTLILLNALYGSFTAIFRAFERMTPILVLNLIGLVAQFVGTIVLIVDGRPVLALVVLAVSVQALQLIAALAIYRARFPHAEKNQLDRAVVVKVLLAAIPFAFAGIIGAIEMRANFVLLGIFQDERAVGLYSVASRFTDSAKFIPNAFFGAIFPVFAAMGSNADNYFRRARLVLVLFSVGIALVITLLAQPILALSFGSAFETAQTPLVILAWSLVPALLNGLTMLFLYARGDESSANRALAFSLIIQLAITVPLITSFGSSGAAFAALVGDIALFILLKKNFLYTFYSLAKPLATPIVIFSVTLLLRLLLINRTQFDGLYGQDPYAYLDYANTLKSSLAGGELPPPFFWPLGYPALVALLSTLVPMGIAAQATSVIASALAAVLVYFIVCEILRGQPQANFSSTIAALAFASAGQMMISSLSAMSDTAGLFWATLAVYALIRSRRDSSVRWVALAGFAMGFAVMTRWVYALLLPGWVFALASHLHLRSVQVLRASILSGAPFGTESKRAVLSKAKASNLESSRKFRPLVDSYFVSEFTLPLPLIRGGLGRGLMQSRDAGWLGVAFLFFFLALSPQLGLMIYHATHGVISNVGDLQTVSWNLTNAWQSSIINSDGHFTYSLPIAAFYAQPLAHPSFIFPILTPLILLGAWSLRHDHFILILLAGWTLAMWVFLAGIAWENPRFSLAFFPPLAILVGIGLHWAIQVLPRFEKLAWAWAIVGIVLTILWSVRATDNFVAQQRADRAIAAWTNTQLPVDSTLIAFGITETLKHRTPFRVVEIYNESPESLERILSTPSPIFLLLNTENIESQWKNMTPDINFRTLQAKSNLRLVAIQNSYTLFSVNPSP